VKNLKKVQNIFGICSIITIILSQIVFNYFSNLSLIRNLGYLKDDANSKLINLSIISLIFSIIIALLLITAYVIYSKKIVKKHNCEDSNKDAASYSPAVEDNVTLKNKDNVLNICSNIDGYSEEIGVSMSELSNFTDSQAAYIEQFSAALEEVSSGVQQTAENTQQAANFVSTIHGTVSILTESIGEVASAAEALTKESENARTAVKDGEKIITDAIGEMNSVSIRIKDLADSITTLGDSAEQVGRIIEVINSIANQTNMLGLNASIEAARAGEYGRGFSVVAKSIKELSDKSKDATNSISEIIRNIQDNIKEAIDKSNQGLLELESGMSLVKASGDSINNILYIVDTTHSYASSVTESTKLQDESSKEVMDSINELNNVVQEVSATTMQQSASIQQVASGVQTVKECIDELAAGTQEIVTLSSTISEESKQLMEVIKA
jgi:methyl-accepting chemotaxis protein